jgi:hypothetical protein
MTSVSNDIEPSTRREPLEGEDVTLAFCLNDGARTRSRIQPVVDGQTVSARVG